jgi:LmbE family N-acetylglucosaminyl deacetylase
VRHLGLPDGDVAWADRTPDALGELVQLIRTFRPRVAITFGPDGLYGHTDHVAVNELVLKARRAAADPAYVAPVAGDPLRPYWIPRLFYPVMTAEYVVDLLEQLAAAGLDAQLWALRASDFHVPSSAISASVDVSSVLDRKLRALHSHRTQLEPDNALGLLTGELAVRFLGVEHFRCADGQRGDPLTG